MSIDPIGSFEAELGARIPEGLEGLAGDELEHLAGLLREAKARQARELDTGVDGSLDFIPRLVRGPVRRILFG